MKYKNRHNNDPSKLLMVARVRHIHCSAEHNEKHEIYVAALAGEEPLSTLVKGHFVEMLGGAHVIADQ